MRRLRRAAGIAIGGALVCAPVLSCPIALAQPAGTDGAASRPDRYLVMARSAEDVGPLRTRAGRLGARPHEPRGTTTLAIDATPDEAAALAVDPQVALIARDHVESLIDPESGPTRAAPGPAGPSAPSIQNRRVERSRGVPQDPAASLPGLLWNQARIHAPQADAISPGSPEVTVGVADTGLDYTHSELKGRVVHVEDFTTVTSSDSACKTPDNPNYPDDAALAKAYQGPADGDWHGHGSWIGGTIAAALDGVGVNGIAPKIGLVSLKIAQSCGYAYDSDILAAVEYAARRHIDVVSISFGGYLDRTKPDEDAVYRAWLKTVAEARRAGTLIVAASGNEHLRVGAGGQVLSHGSLTVPGDQVEDLFGMYEVPGGVPGVVDVSATVNVVASPSGSCPAPAPASVPAPNPALDKRYLVTCKPRLNAHQATGIGRTDQLAYYSNYGPRIDIAAPGGGRKFNLPRDDGGGTPGFPYTDDDGTTAFQEFSITSNWATQIPCFEASGQGVFYPGECYTTIQGTSMATPHVSAVAALIVSAHPWLRHRPAAIVDALTSTARRDVGNATRALSADDHTAGDLTGTACAGYCHLGGPRISDDEAYGSGIVDALAALR
jgi:subtilisin family serine protease